VGQRRMVDSMVHRGSMVDSMSGMVHRGSMHGMGSMATEGCEGGELGLTKSQGEQRNKTEGLQGQHT